MTIPCLCSTIEQDGIGVIGFLIIEKDLFTLFTSDTIVVESIREAVTNKKLNSPDGGAVFIYFLYRQSDLFRIKTRAKLNREFSCSTVHLLKRKQDEAT